MEIDESDAGVAAGAPISDAERFSMLKRATRDTPTDYAAHLNLVTYLRKERPGSLDLLKAREDFAARFPLSAELWEEWIADRQATGGDSCMDEVLALYRRAFGDYQCAKLWPGFLRTLEASLEDEDDGGVSQMRQAFEDALGQVGVHPKLGGAVWRAYVQFEKDEMEDAKEIGATDSKVSKALERIKRLYRRQMAVPLVGNDALFPEMCEAFAGDKVGLEEAFKAHARASKMLESRLEHEEAIARCQELDLGGVQAANAWETYAEMEKGEGHPSRAVLVLERAESEGCCLHERVWLMHSDLLIAEMGANDLEVKVTARAVRNLPWSSELWCRRLRSLERLKQQKQQQQQQQRGIHETCSSAEEEEGGKAAATGFGSSDVREVWREALASALPSPDDFVKVLLTYCAQLRRRLVTVVELAMKASTVSGDTEIIGAAMPPGYRGQGGDGEEDEEDEPPSPVALLARAVSKAVEELRVGFDEAEAFVEKNYSSWTEGWLALVRQRIQVEDEVVQDIAQLGLPGVEVDSEAPRQWERVLRRSGKRLSPWLEAISSERTNTADMGKCRKLFARAIREVEDYPEAAYAAFLNFEVETGSIADWDLANKQVFDTRVSRGHLSKGLPMVSRVWPGGDAALPLHQPPKYPPSARKDSSGQASRASRRKSNDRAPKQASNKRGLQARDAGGSGEGNAELGSRGVDKSSSDAGSSKRARTDSAPLSPMGVGTPLKAGSGSGPGKEVDHRDPAHREDTKRVEPRMVFVLNLALSTREAGLKEIFQACGDVAGCRLLMNARKESRGMGYVSFATEEAFSKALKLDGTEISGRVIRVQESLAHDPRASASGSVVAGNREVVEDTGISGVASQVVTEHAGAAQGSRSRVGDTHAKGAGTGGGGAAGAEGSKKQRKGGGELVGPGGVRWPVHPTTVFVKGLGPDAISEGLKEAFSAAGAVLEARIVVDKKTHAKKDYGLVQFEHEDSVVKALALDGTRLCGNKVSVSRSRHPALIPAARDSSSKSDSTSKDVTVGDDGDGKDIGAVKGMDAPPSSRQKDETCVNPKPNTATAAAARPRTPTVVHTKKPRIFLGSMLSRPRALRSDQDIAKTSDAAAVTNRSIRKNGVPPKSGANDTQSAAGGRDTGTMLPPPPITGSAVRRAGADGNSTSKSNADFRAMLDKK